MKNGQPYWEVLHKYPKWFFSNNFNFLSDYKEKEFRILQLGVFTGDASQYFANHILKHPHSILVDVDTWTGSPELYDEKYDWYEIEDIYDDRMQHHIRSGKVIKNKTTTDDFFKKNKLHYDLIYIDASHEFKDVYNDAANSLKWVKSNGYILFDDYNINFDTIESFGVKKAVDKFLKDYADSLNVINIGEQALVQVK